MAAVLEPSGRTTLQQGTPAAPRSSSSKRHEGSAAGLQPQARAAGTGQQTTGASSTEPQEAPTHLNCVLAIFAALALRDAHKAAAQAHAAWDEAQQPELDLQERGRRRGAGV